MDRVKPRLNIGYTIITEDKCLIYQKIVDGINKAAIDFDVNVLFSINIVNLSIADELESKNQIKESLKYLNSNNIDGLIISSSNYLKFFSKEEVVKFLDDSRLSSVVCIGTPIKNFTTLNIDSYSGINKVINHLHEIHGMKKIAFIGCNANNIAYKQRYYSYVKSLNEYNIPFNKDLVYFINDIDNELEIVKCFDVIFKEKNLSAKKDIEAIVTVSDIAAKNIIEELGRRNIRIPQDIAVIGFNNQIESLKCNYPITTVEGDFYQEGYDAVKYLIEDINKNKIPDKIYNNCNLIIRQSCGCFEDSILKVEKKNIFIEDNENKSCENLLKENLDDIAMNVSNVLKNYDLKLPLNEIMDLLKCFVDDLFDHSFNCFLSNLNKYFNNRSFSIEKLINWINVVSEFRKIILIYIGKNSKVLLKAENIFHQSRVLLDISFIYYNSYKVKNNSKVEIMAKMSAELYEANDLKKIGGVLNKYLLELEIPSIYIELFDNHLKGNESIVSVYGLNRGEEVEFGDNKILQNKYIISKKILIPKKRTSMLLNLSHYKNNFIGFIIYELGSSYMSLYNSFTILLNPSLYNAYLNNNYNNSSVSVEEKRYFLNKIKEIKPNFNTDNIKINNAVDTYKIFDYLYDHITEPTNIDKIAYDFNISKPLLFRKTKKITGFTIQKLHEIIKIEKTKLLLKNDIMSITEISKFLGYQNQFYFSNVFKKNTGYSPKKWKEFNGNPN